MIWDLKPSTVFLLSGVYSWAHFVLRTVKAGNRSQSDQDRPIALEWFKDQAGAMDWLRRYVSSFFFGAFM